jgi:C4-dicarboxylate-specific signal transduction histidine kinase
MTISSSAAYGADAHPPGILIVHSNQRPTAAGIVVENVLNAAIPEGYQRPVTFYSEYLDEEWVSGSAYGEAEADFLRKKYGARNIRVIVASAITALRFTSKFRDRMFPGVPIVHIAIARDALERMKPAADIIGKTTILDAAPTLELIQRLHPEAKRLAVVVGTSERDRAWEKRIRAAVSALEIPLQVEYVANMPTADILRRVAALPRGAIVLSPGYIADGARQVGTPRQSIERIAAASAVPVYGVVSTHMDSGIVGGYMVSYEDQAREAAALVVKLLNGASPTEFEPSSVAATPMVDWRQIRRWGIDERRLPADTVVMFREPSVWETYASEISIAVALLLLQAALIAALLIQRRSRSRTANALAESQRQMNLATSAARLTLWSWTTKSFPAGPKAGVRGLDGTLETQPVALDRVLSAVHPADQKNLERAVERALATGEELDVEYRAVEADGSVRWISARGQAEKSGSSRLFGVALDITERKSAELRAAEDQTALRHMSRTAVMGQLSAAIAHQLNQPLAAILGNAEVAQKMLERDQIDRRDLQEICGDIVQENHRASNVIRRLSALYRRGEMKMETMDVNELVRGTLDLLRTELMIRHIGPTIECAPALPQIDGDPVELQQVVLNLVLNAADAMNQLRPEARRLTVRTEACDTSVCLRVSDNGTGIAADQLNNVFEPFWSTKPNGMGMGLTICRSIVASHHGSISASNNPEGGATFSVTLPRAVKA